ncbi:MAG: hypothetical protein ABJV04_00540 [Aliiglaciecola sp.]|uniref:hypothetical protein n=1 Tax=Aliiglaciecola sp. TaxID=1872441 RepID=UPI0032977BAD
MLKIASILIFMSTLVSITGCASRVIKSESFKTYTVGQTVNSNIGSPFLVAQTGTVQTVRSWVGILNSPDGWESKDVYSTDYLKKELVYSGKSGSIIEVSYREYRGGMAAPAFFQSLKYDLSGSKEISFQNFLFEVENADNSSISITILRD